MRKGHEEEIDNRGNATDVKTLILFLSSGDQWSHAHKINPCEKQLSTIVNSLHILKLGGPLEKIIHKISTLRLCMWSLAVKDRFHFVKLSG